MQKHLIQALLFLGVISIPTFASAEGGLLSTVTNEVNAVTDKATITVNDAVSAPDEEKVKPSAETTSDDENQSKGNVISETVDSVTDTVDRTTGTVTGTVNAATKTAGNTVNRTVEQTTEPVTDIVGDSTAPVTETVNNTTKAVTNTVEKTTKSVTGMVDSTTKTVTETVEETTKPVSDSLSDDKPLLEVDLSDDPEVKVNTGIVDVEVSEDPQVKVDTGVVDADVSKKPSVKVDTGIVETEVKDEPSVDIKIENDDAEVEKVDVRKEPVKQEVTAETSAEKADQSSIRMSKAKQLNETILTKPAEVEQKERAKAEESEKQNELPFTPVKEMEPLLTTTTLHTTSQSSSTSGVSGQVTGSTSLWYVSDQQAMAVNFQKANLYEKKNLYYDQWLNAPPSQPPQAISSFQKYIN
ncbi:hypothetical protein [Rossellomorea aquimaris]|uniref:Uncharacterized protein n=1 Tax=Rossellomorea aquimaris TaxID=189382 RepID=A0A5D4U2F2_9BACI|nr:hypothetical protein [Rossellomorea aquimaris]TYS81453.1 hypothetical protein FZD05_01135 [Rossellomorea aquimaris]TYS88076.1 hypothetical protein FZC85_01140 [Rossellomorea aquimaris]